MITSKKFAPFLLSCLILFVIDIGCTIPSEESETDNAEERSEQAMQKDHTEVKMRDIDSVVKDSLQLKSDTVNALVNE